MGDTDLERIFNALPAQYAAYDLEWNIVAVTDALLRSLKRDREDVVGKNQFEAFPDDPDDATSSGNASMRGGFERVLAERVGHRLPVTRYDVAEADGTYRERYWLPFNEPVFDEAGDIVSIIHGVEEVTDSVLSSRGD